MKLRTLKPIARTRGRTPTRLPAAVARRRISKCEGVPLRIVAPAAKQVFVAGSFNDWHAGTIPLTPCAGGEWRGELKLPPGRYEYLFVVDGKWLPDPSANETAPNPFGGRNSVLSII